MKAGPKTIISWREWVSFPDLGVEAIKVKVDTGARTSSIHAFRIKEFTQDGELYVKFLLHPLQKKKRPELVCTARVADKRVITSSNGERQRRIIIVTTLNMAGDRWPIEISLAARDQMSFRALLGREAIRGRFLVNPAGSYKLENLDMKGKKL